MIGEAHRHLRDTSQSDHQRLEARIDILQAVSTPAGRLRLVQGFHRLHAEAEASLAPWLEDLADLDFDRRRRTARLAADLTDLGGRALSPSPSDVRVGSLPEALGWMYVLEGSTLGGKTIRRALSARGEDMTGLRFLEPYGAQVGDFWRAFLTILESHVHGPQDVARMAAGARAAFRHAERRLCGDPVLV